STTDNVLRMGGEIGAILKIGNDGKVSCVNAYWGKGDGRIRDLNGEIRDGIAMKELLDVDFR
ncbi:hypothetical protein, partial [Paraburkholderia sp. RL17-373-BIF-A]|uniref:hypothetical protein n=1 Tax=Paraburkholderia sp. RL17-373-BIF-A TaxID=3031629 RepID=UPI0038B8090B